MVFNTTCKEQMIKNILIAYEWSFDNKSVTQLAKKLKTITNVENIHIVESSYYNNASKLPSNIDYNKTLGLGFGLGSAKLLGLSKDFAKFVFVSSLAQYNCNEHNKRHLETIKLLFDNKKTVTALNGFVSRSGVVKYETSANKIDKNALLQDLALMESYNLQDYVLQNKENILAITGENDLIINLQDFENQFKDISKVVIKGSNHNLVMEKPLEVANNIKKFIS